MVKIYILGQTHDLNDHYEVVGDCAKRFQAKGKNILFVQEGEGGADLSTFLGYIKQGMSIYIQKEEQGYKDDAEKLSWKYWVEGVKQKKALLEKLQKEGIEYHGLNDGRNPQDDPYSVSEESIIKNMCDDLHAKIIALKGQGMNTDNLVVFVMNVGALHTSDFHAYLQARYQKDGVRYDIESFNIVNSQEENREANLQKDYEMYHKSALERSSPEFRQIVEGHSSREISFTELVYGINRNYESSLIR